MNNSTKHFFIFLIFFGSLSGFAQKYTLDNDTSFLQVLGTSTLHDWYIQVENQSGSIAITNLENLEFSELTFSTQSESFKSGKKAMDKKTYKALQTDTYKNIEFSMLNVKSSTTKSANTKVVVVEGNLTVCGVTKKIELKFELEKQDNLIVLDGSHKLLMTEYGIQPPKALLGTIKTGDEVEIKFKSIFTN